MRLLNFLVIVALVVAAAYVYGIKFNSTQRIERAAKLRAEIRRERDAIAALRAEWAKLDNPARVQGLASRHLRLRPLEATQIDSLDRLPARPPARDPGTCRSDRSAPGTARRRSCPPEACRRESR